MFFEPKVDEKNSCSASYQHTDNDEEEEALSGADKEKLKTLLRKISKKQNLDDFIRKNKQFFTEKIKKDNNATKRTSLLQCAVLSDNKKAVKTLLEYSANPNAVDEKLSTLLHSASSKFVVKQLIKHGAKVDAKDSEGISVLMKAYFMDHYDVLEYLLDKTNVNSTNLQSIFDIEPRVCNKKFLEIMCLEGYM